MELDRERLAKLLGLTESDHDGEALAAIRKANEFLRLHNTSWPQALGIVTAPVAPSSHEEPQTGAAPQEDMEPAARVHPSPPSMPAGYIPMKTYRSAFLREPLIPRLLGFPFWIMLELLAVIAPTRLVNIRGRWLTVAFTLSMMLGITAWIVLAYVALIGSG